MNKIIIMVLFIPNLLFAKSHDNDQLVFQNTHFKLEELLSEVGIQTGMSLSYGKIDPDFPISLPQKEMTLEEVMDWVKKQTPYEYSIRNSKILLREKKTQKKIISGYIYGDGEPLIGASVAIAKKNKGVITGSFGEFSIHTAKDSLKLKISFIGFKTKWLTVHRNTQNVVSLEASPVIFDEVIITSKREDLDKIELLQLSTVSVDAKEIKQRPTLLGEPDALKSLQFYPGVQSGNEGSSALYVRGGGPGQNLFLLDGVPLYNTSHLFGFLSSFSANSIDNIRLTKGGFPARFGGRLSSIVETEFKKGNKEKIGGAASIGLLNSQLTLDGPIGKKTTFMVSGRRTFLDPFMRPVIDEGVDEDGVSYKDVERLDVFFYDINGKLSHQFSENDLLTFTIYNSKDAGFNRNTSFEKSETENSSHESVGKMNWGNTLTSLDWQHHFGEKWQSNISFSTTRYQFQILSSTLSKMKTDIIDFEQDDRFESRTEVSDKIGKVYFNYLPNSTHHLRFGVSATWHEFTPNIVSVRNSNQRLKTTGNKIRATEVFSFVEDEIRVTEKLSLNLGIHASIFSVDSTFYKSIQPRISASYKLSSRYSLSASYSQMTQYVHLLVQPSVGLPSDLWVPSTNSVKPETAQQVSAGLYYSNVEQDWSASIESYYKQMDNLIEYQEGVLFINSDVPWHEKITSGKGNSYGFEFFVEKRFQKTNGWIGYTLSWANREFNELNAGRPFPYRYDRRHDINFIINHQFNDRISIGANWVYATGLAVTIPKGKFKASYAGLADSFNDYALLHNGPYSYVDEKNDYRMRAYHRLDISLRFHKKKKWGERNLVVGVYNAYNRLNPFYLEVTSSVPATKDLDSGLRKDVISEVAFFPIIPSIYYEIKF